MAQPNQHPLSARQRMLEFILDRNQYALQNRLLGNVNLFDYMSLRHLTRRTLQSLDPVNLQTPPGPQPNPPAVPLAGPPGPPPVVPPAAPPGPQLGPPTAIPGNPQAAPQNNAINFLQRRLGARCDETRRLPVVFHLGAPVPQLPVPCPDGPTRMIRMRHCEQTNPQSHPPFPTRCFNVCDDCLHGWDVFYQRQITNSVPSKRSILCKRCSLSLRRQHQPGHNACRCTRDVVAGVKCHTCRRETELAIYARGDAQRRRLERTHIRHTGKGSKRRRILHVDNTVRSRAACARPNCGREAWTKHYLQRVAGENEPTFSKHRDACLMCLCCNGEYVP